MNTAKKLMMMMRSSGDVDSSPLLTNLVAYWRLDEASDGSAPVARADAYGSNNLTDNNTTPSGTGVISNAAAFVGTNTEFLSIAVSDDLKGGDRDWAMDGWFKLTDRTATQELASSGTARTNQTVYEMRLFAASSQVTFRLSNGVGLATVTLGSAPANDTWCYFYAYHDAASDVIGGGLNNGSLATPVAFVANAAFSPGGYFRLGASPVGDLSMTGSMDEVARWNRLLTETERLDRWNGGSGNTYPFL